VSIYYRMRLILVVLSLLGATSCGSPPQQDEVYELKIKQALARLGLDAAYPPSMIALGSALKGSGGQKTRSETIAEIINSLDIGKAELFPSKHDDNPDSVWNALVGVSPKSRLSEMPPEWRGDAPVFKAIRSIIAGITDARRTWEKSGGQASASELEAVRPHILRSFESSNTPEPYRLVPPAYHLIGKRVDAGTLASSLLRLFARIETVLPLLAQAESPWKTVEWETPLGRIRIAGRQNDIHEGDFLLLIDLGGDDTYRNVNSNLIPGKVSVVIDLDGDDSVAWKDGAGPGSGVFGMGVWFDLAGNDRYQGGTMGLGSALFGSAIFWDEAGDDTYEAEALVQGVGQYGVGIFVDARGNDRYQAFLSGQGYAGPGGVGVLADFNGDDKYNCGGKYPDPVAKRARRHQGIHYLSMCQGYAFGLRPEISGGIGVLIDRAGDDSYKADIFAQGASYWFGLGMLVDSAGNDLYEAYEHCQGEGLHLSAGFLGDWGGDDRYVAYEHAQGVGMDRSAGILYDDSGNDVYSSHFESQGDNRGDDRYEAKRDSQGYAKPDPDPKFPESEWPTGILLDLHGSDVFDQPYADVVDSTGRIQNKQGIAIAR